MATDPKQGDFAYIPQKNFLYVVPGNRTGREPVKSPLPFINPENPEESVAEQMKACANCKDSTCSSLGCSQGKDIGAANVAISKAGTAANNAFEVLKKHSLDDAEEFTKRATAAMRVDIPDYAELTDYLFELLAKYDRAAAKKYERHFGNFMKEAYKIYEEGGGDGDIYSLACPAESVTCMSQCQIEFAMARGIVIPMGEGAVYLYADKKGFRKPVNPVRERPEKVAFIGSGAVARHGAIDLRKGHLGYQVDVFEKNKLLSEIGDGKILSYKVPQDIWQRNIDRQKASDVKFHPGTPIGVNGKPIFALANNFNAIVIATGIPVAKHHRLEGDAQNNVLFSNEYLQAEQNVVYRQQFLNQINAALPSAYNAKGKHVFINGHGDTAIDCARAAIAQGALSVTLISRHDGINARDSGDKAAFEQLKKEAGDKLKFQHYMSVKEINKSGDGYILRGKNNADGLKGQPIELEADIVISAIGTHTGDLKQIFGLESLPTTKAGTLKVQLPALSNKSLVNGILGGFIGRFPNGTAVFAGGEVVTGPSLLVTAGKAGIDLAPQIHKYLQNPDAFYKEVEAVSGYSVAEIY